MRRHHLLALVSLAVGCTDDLRVLIPLPTPDGSVAPIGDAGDASVEPDGEVDADAATPEPLRATAVAAFMQTCATGPDGAYCWGDNATGAVGPVDRGAQLTPARVLPGSFSKVCAGEEHTCALRSDGVVLCWGTNTQGQLGQGDFQPRQGVVEVRALRFASLACGGDSTCATAMDGRVHCWGDNGEGQLGQAERDGSHDDSPLPLPIASDERFAQVSLGQGHACGVAEDGALYCWGRNTLSQLGVADAPQQLRVPTRVANDRKFVRVATGQGHSCAVDTDGQLHCWGDNPQIPAVPPPNPDDAPTPLLGVASTDEIVRTPERVVSDVAWADVAANWFHSCGLTREGALLCWGRNREGQLGVGDIVDRATPVRVGALTGWSTVAIGRFHTCAARSEGLYCWGMNELGQLASGDRRRHAMPLPVYVR